MQVLLYQGLSFVSRLIKGQTRSIYSHAAIRLLDGTVVEAWAGAGVRRIPNASFGHKDGTLVDVFHVEGDYDASKVEAFLLSQVGQDYDYWSVARFLTRRRSPANDKWFCSELAVEAFRQGGLSLLNGPPSMHSPRDVALSPLLRKITTLGGSG